MEPASALVGMESHVDVGHPYRSICVPTMQSLASKAMHLSHMLAEQEYHDRRSLSDSVEDLLVSSGYDDLCHYDLERPVYDRFAGVCCSYFNKGGSVVKLERITSPTSYSMLDICLHEIVGVPKYAFLYFICGADGLVDNLSLFGRKNRRSVSVQSAVEKECWQAIRSYPYCIDCDSHAQMSGQLLLQAVNFSQGVDKCR